MCLEVPLQSIFAREAFRIVLATLHLALVRPEHAVAALLVALDIFGIFECSVAL